MILNIRGTHGSGKSYIVQQLLKRFRAKPILNGAKIEGYEMNTSSGLLYAVGPYKTACGGCDAVQPYDLIWPRVEEYAKLGSVVFEGALISSCIGAIGKAMAARNDCVLGFMTTPLDTCLDRIRARRAASGNDKPLNPKNTQSKFESIQRNRFVLAQMGLRCVDVPFKNSLPTILEILNAR
jgi:hypothetical protein